MEQTYTKSHICAHSQLVPFLPPTHVPEIPHLGRPVHAEPHIAQHSQEEIPCASSGPYHAFRSKLFVCLLCFLKLNLKVLAVRNYV